MSSDALSFLPEYGISFNPTLGCAWVWYDDEDFTRSLTVFFGVFDAYDTVLH